MFFDIWKFMKNRVFCDTMKENRFVFEKCKPDYSGKI